MEKENAQLQKRHNFHEIKRIKLEYDEIMPIDRQLSDVWDNFIVQHSTSPISDPKIFLQAIKSGVPRAKRGGKFQKKNYNINTISIKFLDLFRCLDAAC